MLSVDARFYEVLLRASGFFCHYCKLSGFYPSLLKADEQVTLLDVARCSKADEKGLWLAYHYMYHIARIFSYILTCISKSFHYFWARVQN